MHEKPCSSLSNQYLSMSHCGQRSLRSHLSPATHKPSVKLAHQSQAPVALLSVLTISGRQVGVVSLTRLVVSVPKVAHAAVIGIPVLRKMAAKRTRLHTVICCCVKRRHAVCMGGMRRCRVATSVVPLLINPQTVESTLCFTATATRHHRNTLPLLVHRRVYFTGWWQAISAWSCEAVKAHAVEAS